MFHKRLAFLAAALIAAGALAADDAFKLTDIRSLREYGPFQPVSGATASIGGTSYMIKSLGNGRLSFMSRATGVEWGPIQIVDGRLGVIGHSTYKVTTVHGGQTSAGNTGNGRRGAAATATSPFVQPPPAMPELIDVPEPQQRRTVAPLDLPVLPETDNTLFVAAWLALVDNTPTDWKLDSKSAGDGAIERVSVGAEIRWNGWSLAATASPSVSCDDIGSGGAGLAGASLKDGTGWSLGIGYMRPFLVEGGWSASAGLRGLLRRDSGDLKSSSLVSSGEIDTNAVDNVVSRYENHTASVDITELSLWIDIELTYSDDFWGVKAGVSIVPVSEFDISASIPYADGSLSLDAERSSPIAVSVGGWYEYEGWRFFSDIAIGANRAFRLGAGRGF